LHLPLPPQSGRYDDEKSAAENIDFLPTILSRFDLIFIVRDLHDETRDKAWREKGGAGSMF